MKLHAPGFERALRRRVRRTVQGSRELKKEFRQANRFRRPNRFGWVFRPLYGCLLGYLAWLVTAQTGHLATGLGLINLWLFTLLTFHTAALWACLNASLDLPALHLLPVPDGRIFRWQLQKYFRSTFFALMDLGIAFGVLAAAQHFPPWKWALALLLAALSWLMLMALAALAAARLPRWPFQFMSATMILLGVAVFFTRTVLGDFAIRALDQCAPTLNLLLPTGWAASLFQLLPADRQWWPAFLVVPIAAILWTTRDSLRRLAGCVRFREYLLALPSDVLPEEAEEAGPSPDKPLQLGPTAIEEIIQTRRFLEPPLWPQRGWLEQRLWRWLTPRERALADFVFPKGFPIAAPWKSILRNLAIALVGAGAAGLISPTARLSVLGLGLFVTICQTLAQFFSQGRAFQPMWCSGVNTPIYAGFGIGFRELSGLLFKCSIIQLPLVLAFTATAGCLTALMTGFPAVTGMIFGLKIGGLFFGGRFIMVAFAFSSGTNDNTRFTFRTVALGAFIAVFGLLFLGLAGAGLFLPAPLPAWALWGGAVLEAYGFYWIYSWFYNAGRFDLMNLPRR